MGKTEKTLEMERAIYRATKKQGVFGCFEVTIGWFGKERVDYLTYDTKDIWRCYEIKTSKEDFHSNAKKTFVGHYNYFVLTPELYEQVVDEIPEPIGIYVGGSLVKRAKKQALGVDADILKNSFIRSLSRGQEKIMISTDVETYQQLQKQLKRLERERREEHQRVLRYQHALREVCERNGLDYRKIKNEFI